MSVLHTVVLAIALSAPWMHSAQRRTYAKAIVHAADRAHVPPILFVAIIENESRWNASAVNSGGYSGLGQVSPTTFPACRADRSSPACAAVRSMLLDGVANIAVMGTVLRANRRYCGRRLDRLLAGYQTGKCRPVPLTRHVLHRFYELQRAVQPHRR